MGGADGKVQVRRFFLIFLFAFFFSCENSAYVPPSVLFTRGLQPVETGLEEKTAGLSSSACIKCHSRSHSQWAAGMHAKAWKDPLFQRAYAIEPRNWCVHCHAPLRSQAEELKSSGKDGSLLAEGINCAGCHIRNGKILGLREYPDAPHKIEVSSYLSRSEFCAECHQFNFPIFHGEEVQYTEHPMQNTWREWKESGYEQDCQFCHYDGHSLKGPHSGGWLADHFSNFTFDFPGREVLSIRFEVDEGRAHRLPTGDLFKSLALEISPFENFEKVIFIKQWARRYGLGQLSGGTFWNRSLLSDSSLTANQTSVNITIDVPSSGPLFARLIYRHNDPRLGGPVSASIENEIVILSRKVR